MLHRTSFADLSAEMRRRYPGDIAVVCAGVRLDYPELDSRASRLADALAATGVRYGDRIAWIGQTCHRVLELFLAAAKLGAVLAPVNWRLAAEEMAFIVDDLEPVVVFWQQAETGDAVAACRPLVSVASSWLQVDGDVSEYEELLATGRDIEVERDIDLLSPLLIIYTAAFSGRPNGALLHHEGLLSTAVVRGFLSGIDASTVYLNATNFYHVGNWDYGTLPTMAFGGRNVFLRRWDAAEGARLIDAEKVTLAFMPGPMYKDVTAAAAEAGLDISTLQPPSEVASKVSGYGQTELHGVQLFRSLSGERAAIGGKPSPLVQARLLDDHGAEVPDGQAGEICVRGPVVMAGYHNRPELNAKALAGGWRRTNDLGRREPDGSISFVGVKERMLKSGAENIYPAEVEAAIKRHPAVRDCAVIGYVDPEWDQSVMAIIEHHDGVTTTEVQIIEHCRSVMASYKKPRVVRAVAALPRLANGRIDFAELDQLFGGGGYPGEHVPPHPVPDPGVGAQGAVTDTSA